MRVVIPLLALGLGGCGDEAVPQHGLAPVLEANAPVVSELLSSGLVIVDMHEVACEAGPDVACDGFDALYLGREAGPDDRGVALFACPGTEEDSDNWKCREVNGNG